MLLVLEVLVEGLARDAGAFQHLGHRRLGVATFGDRLGHRDEEAPALRGEDLLASQPMASPGELLDLHHRHPNS